MSDSNVGGRKRRNIRDNLFVTYGVMNFVTNNKMNVDINITT